MKMQNEVIETKYEFIQVHDKLYHINSELQEYFRKGWEPYLLSTTTGNSGTVYVTYLLKRKLKQMKN